MWKWIIGTVVVISGTIFGTLIYSLDHDIPFLKLPPAMQTNTEGKTIVAHAMKDGVQRFSTQIFLPHSCYALREGAQRDPDDRTKLMLFVEATERATTTTTCTYIKTGYPIDFVIEDTTNYAVSLTVNGKVLPVSMLETDWKAGGGTLVNPYDVTNNQSITKPQ